MSVRLTCLECGHVWCSEFDDDDCPNCNPPPDRFDMAIKDIEDWIYSIRNARPKDGGDSLKEFIHKKCMDSPLKSVSCITDIVGLMT